MRGFAEPRMLLSDFLRHELGRTEVHVACEQGVCGACTVLLDGKPARSCLTFAVQASGRRVETVRSLSPVDGRLNDLQEFVPPSSRAAMRLLHAGHLGLVRGIPA